MRNAYADVIDRPSAPGSSGSTPTSGNSNGGNNNANGGDATKPSTAPTYTGAAAKTLASTYVAYAVVLVSAFQWFCT